MTELHHFHPARKGSGSLRPFPIYPLYTQTVILSLDKPIADCFLFRPRKSRKSAGNAVIPTFPMHRSYGLQGSLKRRYKHPSPTSINGYHTAKKLLSQSPAKRPTFAFAGESGYTLAFANRIAHSGSHGETGGVSDGGAITTLGTFRTFTNIPGPGVRTAYFAALGSWPGGAPEERREPAEQRCAYARRCSEASRPRWAA